MPVPKGKKICMAPRVQLRRRAKPIEKGHTSAARTSRDANKRQFPRTWLRKDELLILAQVSVETPAGPTLGMQYQRVTTANYVAEFCRLNHLTNCHEVSSCST